MVYSDKGSVCLIHRLHHFHPHSEGCNDTVENTDTWGDNAVFYLRNIRLCGLCTLSQFALSHLSLFASILKYLARIERIGSLLSSCTFGSTFFAELGIKNGIVVNDFVIVCHGCKVSKSCRIVQLFEKISV